MNNVVKFKIASADSSTGTINLNDIGTDFLNLYLISRISNRYGLCGTNYQFTYLDLVKDAEYTERVIFPLTVSEFTFKDSNKSTIKQFQDACVFKNAEETYGVSPEDTTALAQYFTKTYRDYFPDIASDIANIFNDPYTVFELVNDDGLVAYVHPDKIEYDASLSVINAYCNSDKFSADFIVLRK